MKKLLVLLIFMASYAHATIYTWTDKGGTKHYTNSIYEIPEKYRTKAKALDLGIMEEKGENAAGQQPGSAQPAGTAPAMQPGGQAQPAGPPQYPTSQRTSDHHGR